MEHVEKIRFIHLRDSLWPWPFNSNDASPFGGRTYAWMVTKEGNILVGQPALCHKNDHFVKSIGRKVSQENLLSSKPYIARITKDALISDARKSIHSRLAVSGMKLDKVNSFVDAMMEEVEKSMETTMCISWFEAIVREKIKNIENSDD